MSKKKDNKNTKNDKEENLLELIDIKKTYKLGSVETEVLNGVNLKVKKRQSILAVGYTVNEDNKLEMVQDWEIMYGKLSRGEYRLIKSISIKKLNFAVGDYVVITGSVPELLIGGTNFIKIHQIKNPV